MPEQKYKNYTLEIAVLTPLHIGNGRTLLNGYDHSIHNHKTWRVDEYELLEQQMVENPAKAEELAGKKPRDVLHQVTKGDYQVGSPLFLYTLEGLPLSSDQSIREQIKNSDNLPYIPGSSLKGALRTALGWSIWQQKGFTPTTPKIMDRSGRFKDGKFAGQEYEKDIFGRKPGNGDGSDPNYDLMRALQVKDSSPAPKDKLILINAAVTRRGFKEADKITSLEAIARGTEITTELKIDTQLFSMWARARGLILANGSSDAQGWLTGFVENCRAYTHHRIQEELNYFESCERDRSHVAKNLYEQFQYLEGELLTNQFWLQLGWGTGWDSKTFGSNLRTSDPFMTTILKQYRLSRNHPETKPDGYPMTRRLIYTGQKRLGHPLGWVRVEVKEKKET